MASFAKFKADSVGGLFKHNNRTGSDIVHDNEEIDISRTMYNYFIKRGSPEDVTQRLGEIFDTGRKDRVVLAEMVVTLPKNVPREDEKAFFRCVYDFYCNDFGERNVINAVVHKDERNPHIHLDLIPVVTGEINFERRCSLQLEQYKQQHAERVEELGGKIERLCCDEAISREYLRSMHSRLSNYVEQEMGYTCDVLNGATTNGNKKVLELKVETLQQKNKELAQEREILQKEVEVILSIAKENGLASDDIGLLPLVERIADLSNQNNIYKNIINANRYPYSATELQQLKDKRYFPSMLSKVNVYDGNLMSREIDANAIVVIELYNRIERPLPQKYFIDTDSDLQNRIRLSSRMSNGAIVSAYSSRTTNRTYILIKADDTKETLVSLYELQELLRKNEKEWKDRQIYMEKMEYDEYNFARSVLIKSQYQATYYTGNNTSDEKDGREKAIQKE